MSLCVLGAGFLQRLQYVFVLDGLGDHDAADILCQSVDGTQEGMAFCIGVQIPGKSAVDLEDIDRKPLEIIKGTESGTEIVECKARTGRVIGVGCGHLHRAVQVSWEGVPVSVCPSAAFQSLLCLGSGRFEASVDDPPAYHLHYWDGSSLVTHCVTAITKNRKGGE